MANPSLTYNETVTELVHEVAREQWGSPRPGISQTSVPGVAGVFVSQYGQSGRSIQGSGYVFANGATKSAALILLLSGLRTNQAMVNATPNTYTSIDGTTHNNCILVSYQQVGRIQYEVGATVKARLPVRFALLQQVAD